MLFGDEYDKWKLESNCYAEDSTDEDDEFEEEIIEEIMEWADGNIKGEDSSTEEGDTDEDCDSTKEDCESSKE
jgi:hypothetical protein